MNFAQLLALDPSSFRRRPVVPPSPPFDVINYGLLYNWYALSAGAYGTIISLAEQSNGWVVPNGAMCDQLLAYYGGDSYTFGGALKETGLTYWSSPNTGALNTYKLNIRGQGRRTELGTFTGKLEEGLFGAEERDSTTFFWGKLTHDSAAIQGEFADKKTGIPVRLVRPATTAEQLLPDGTACEYYHGTDGKVYRTVKIGTQVWLADNLAETMLPEFSYIDGWSAEGYVPISDVDWAAKTSAALCCYNDQITNI